MKALVLGFLALLAGPGVSAAGDFSKDPEHFTSAVQLEDMEGSGLGAAGNGKPRELLPIALDLIKDFEKWRPNAYNDAANFCTVGYGHLVARKSCEDSAVELAQFAQPLPTKEGLELLDRDTALARWAVARLVSEPTSDEQFGALVSFVFNIGADKFARSTMRKYLNNGEMDGALREFPKWVVANKDVSDGLIARRACEASLFAAKLSYREDKKLYREDCAGLGAAPSTERLIDIYIGE